MITADEYRKRLYAMKPNIYIGGERLGRDTPLLEKSINVVATTFDCAAEEELERRGVDDVQFVLRERLGPQVVEAQQGSDKQHRQHHIATGACRTPGTRPSSRNACPTHTHTHSPACPKYDRTSAT